NTPIGNLKDVSLNFLEKIKEVEVILAENPSKSIKLLNYFNISKKMIHYHEWDWDKKREKILSIISKYEKVGFLSSAGSPNIEDPPLNLVKYCLENNVTLEIVPGPSALCAALSLSPLPHTPFIFLGFLDKKNKYLQTLKNIPSYVKSAVFFESCHRIQKTIKNLQKIFPQNYILILHELTKLNQKIFYQKLEEIKEENLINKGEYTAIIYF
ncbi:MAG: 16S rRNA (cytidine(1402)-2'-O)-methyltransferase, partial [bacterium]